MVRRDEALRPDPARVQGWRAAAATTTFCRSEFRKRLITATPGALGLVEEIYKLLDEDGTFDPERMLALYAQHDSDILAPDHAP